VSAGLTTAGRERLHAVAERYVGDGQDPDRYQVPGLVGLVACGDDVHVEALGAMAVGGAPVQRDTIFRIASDTKPITAATVLALAAEGRLDLDEPVDRLLPELAGRRVLRRMDGPLDDTVAAHRAITPRDLLTFTFGFGVVGEMFFAAEPWPVVAAAIDLHLETIGPPNRDAQPDPDTWLAGLGSLPLLAQPGERWFYNTSASVLGVLAARAAGQSFGEAMRTRIFDPLGMADTGLWTTQTGRLVTAYRPSPAGLEAWDQPDGSWSHPPRFGDGAADLLSTAGDLLVFPGCCWSFPDAAGRRLTGAARRAGPGDDHRPAHGRAAGQGRLRAGLLQGQVLGLRPGRAERRFLRLGGRLRLDLADRPES
jgi:CubicO group peptidase (beta-lactamase class C family)